MGKRPPEGAAGKERVTTVDEMELEQAGQAQGVCAKAEADIRNAYDEYNKTITELLEGSGRSSITIMLFKNRTLQDAKVNDAFIAQVRGHVDEIIGALEAGAEPEELAQAEAVVRFMMLEACRDYEYAAEGGAFAKGAWTQSSTYWVFCAMQTLCTPLLRYLSRDALAEIAGEYEQRVPRKRELPNQKKLKKEMRALLKG